MPAGVDRLHGEEAPHLKLLALTEATGERLTTSLEGCRIVWRRWGSGPPLVLLHGGYGSWRHWIHTIPALAPSRTLLVPDLPGLGDSDEVPGAVTPERIAAHVRHGLGELAGGESRLDIVGFSFGSTIANHTAAQMGRSVGSLVLVGPGALGLTIRKVPLVNWNASMAPDESREILRTNLARLLLAEAASIDELAIQIQYENTRRARVKSRKFAVTDTSAQALRRACPARLAVIWGERDAVAQGYFEERQQFFRSLRADVRLHLIPEAGHWVMYEAVDSFNQVLQECLA